MTVIEKIRQLPVDKLADLLVYHTYQISEDWYFNGESEVPYEKYEEVWVTSFGEVFYSKYCAIQAQIAYLQSSIESL